MDIQKKDVLQTVARALRILSFFNDEKSECTLHEISNELEIPKSMVFRTLETLETMGYVKKDEDTKVYSLGFEVFRLGKVVEHNYSLSQVALPILQELNDITKETVCLVIPDIALLRGVQILHVETQHPIKHNVEMSSVGDLHSGASRKVILAYLGEKILQQVIQKGLPKITDATITNPEKLTEEIRQIRERGYAVSRAEAMKDVYSIAAPIIDSRGKLHGSVGIYFPEYRLNEKGPENELIELIKQYGAKISSRLV